LAAKLFLQQQRWNHRQEHTQEQEPEQKHTREQLYSANEKKNEDQPF
jgi:hypothetical protein